jgi:hypothetical protein
MPVADLLVGAGERFALADEHASALDAYQRAAELRRNRPAMAVTYHRIVGLCPLGQLPEPETPTGTDWPSS